jgi:hypothetical protein
VKLSELLDHATQVLDDRAALIDGASDSLWSDEVLCRYFRRAEEIFCEKAWVLKDSTTASCCSVTLVAGQKDYTLHASILRVLAVRPNDSDIDLVRAGYDTIRPRFTAYPSEFWDVNVQYTDSPGRPIWYTTDVANRILRIRPTPRAEDVTSIGTLKLIVARLPITPLSVDTPDSSPEIPEQYHLDLVDYVAGKALMHPNLDSGARREGNDMMRTFYASVRAARASRTETEAAPGLWLFGGWANS